MSEYTLFENDLLTLNGYLASIARRLDSIEGVRREPEVDGYVSALHPFFYNGAAVPQEFNLNSNSVTQGVFRSIGPTGSSADHEWHALDALPEDAVAVYLGNTGRATADASGNINLIISFRPTDSSWTASPVASMYYDITVPNSSVQRFSSAPRWVPITDRCFDIYWDDGAASSPDFFIALVGFAL